MTNTTTQTITGHRPPTAGEIKQGYGATHYLDFNLVDVTKKDGKIKAKTKCKVTGLWYSFR